MERGTKRAYYHLSAHDLNKIEEAKRYAIDETKHYVFKKEQAAQREKVVPLSIGSPHSSHFSSSR